MLRQPVYGLRHGESQANQEGIVLSDPAAGVPGYGLTPQGRAQVRASLAGATGLDASCRIVSSDFARARETAELAAELLGAGPVRLHPALRERWFGEWEGTPNSAYATVWAADALDSAHTRWGVESAAAVTARVTALVAELDEESAGGALLLVAHGDPLQLLQTAFLGLDPGTHRQRQPWLPGELRYLGG